MKRGRSLVKSIYKLTPRTPKEPIRLDLEHSIRKSRAQNCQTSPGIYCYAERNNKPTSQRAVHQTAVECTVPWSCRQLRRKPSLTFRELAELAAVKKHVVSSSLPPPPGSRNSSPQRFRVSDLRHGNAKLI